MKEDWIDVGTGQMPPDYEFVWIALGNGQVEIGQRFETGDWYIKSIGTDWTGGTDRYGVSHWKPFNVPDHPREIKT